MTCTKVIYSSEALAMEDVVRINKRSTRASKPLRAYKCPNGEHWHLTSLDMSYKDKIAAQEAELIKLKAELDKINEHRSSWITGLNAELTASKLEFENYKKHYNRQECIAVRADQRVKDQQAQIKSQSLRIKKLENDKDTLFAKIIQLENKIEELTK